MAHSDAKDAGIDQRHWRELADGLDASGDDAMVVVWADEEDAATAAREVLIRAQETLDGIPAETRQCYANGTTGFERILPGPDRMYPDTDTPPLPIPDSTIAEVRDGLPETPWARQSRYEELGLERGLAQRLAVAPWANLYDRLAPQAGLAAHKLATALEKRHPFYARRNGSQAPLSEERLAPLVRALEQGQFRPEAFERALDSAALKPDLALPILLATFQAKPDDETRLDEQVADVARRAHLLDGKPHDAVIRWAMGEVMPQFLGRVDPREVRARLTTALDEAAEAGR
jgi:glutamyl-tRNA(Gln) amidotransferase subunit E